MLCPHLSLNGVLYCIFCIDHNIKRKKQVCELKEHDIKH